MLYYTYNTFWAYFFGVIALSIVLWPDIMPRTASYWPRILCKCLFVLSNISWLLHFVIPNKPNSFILEVIAIILSFLSLFSLVYLCYRANQDKMVQIQKYLPEIIATIRESVIIFNKELKLINALGALHYPFFIKLLQHPKNWTTALPHDIVKKIKSRTNSTGKMQWNNTTIHYRFIKLGLTGYMLMFTDISKEELLIQKLEQKNKELKKEQVLSQIIYSNSTYKQETDIKNEISKQLETIVQRQLLSLQNAFHAGESTDFLIELTERSLKNIRNIVKNLEQQVNLQ